MITEIREAVTVRVEIAGHASSGSATEEFRGHSFQCAPWTPDCGVRSPAMKSKFQFCAVAGAAGALWTETGATVDTEVDAAAGVGAGIAEAELEAVADEGAEPDVAAGVAVGVVSVTPGK